jgi:hypothetical protein
MAVVLVCSGTFYYYKKLGSNFGGEEGFWTSLDACLGWAITNFKYGCPQV